MLVNMKNVKFLLLLLFILFCLSVAAIQGRYAPFFPNFYSQYVVRGVILEKELFYHSSFVDLYSLKIKTLNDFDLGIKDTIILFPDTVGMNNEDPIRETGSFYKEGDESYVNFYENKYGQLCYSRFLPVKNNKVSGNLTNMQDFLLRRFRISPKGMSIERFERRIKKKIERRHMYDEI